MLLCIELQALAAFEEQFKGSTLRAEDFEVPAVMSAFYALLGVGCVAGGWLALQGRRPVLLGWLTSALWLLSAFLLLFGAGGPQLAVMERAIKNIALLLRLCAAKLCLITIDTCCQCSCVPTLLLLHTLNCNHHTLNCNHRGDERRPHSHGRHVPVRRGARPQDSPATAVTGAAAEPADAGAALLLWRRAAAGELLGRHPGLTAIYIVAVCCRASGTRNVAMLASCCSTCCQ